MLKISYAMDIFLGFANPMIVNTPNSQEYFQDYFILETRWRHNELYRIGSRSANPYMYDHPRLFLSTVLRSGYTEHAPSGIFNRRPRPFTYHPMGRLQSLELPRRAWGFRTPSGWQLFVRHPESQEAAGTMPRKILNPWLREPYWRDSLQWA
ncbi:MAG: hypothetical protein ACYC9J_14535 [Sulfuricaulis sp.]